MCGKVLGFAFVFVLAFFHDVIGWKKILLFLSISTVIETGNVFVTSILNLPFIDYAFSSFPSSTEPCLGSMVDLPFMVPP